MTKEEGLLAKMTFQPWKGPYYQEGYKGKRILIVGESYYEAEWTKDSGNFRGASINAIQKHIDGWKQKTFTHFTSIILDKYNNDVTIEERAAFWNYIVYYNFIQDGLRKKATDNSAIPPQWLINGKEVLKDVLSIYKPDLVIMFSKQIWKHYADYKGKPYSKDYKEHTLLHSKVATFDIEDRENIYHHIVGIYHPSYLKSKESQQELSMFLRKELQLFK